MRVLTALIAAIAVPALAVSPALAAKDDLRLVSRAPGADGKGANAGSYGMAISADGRLVAFGSEASNLHPDDTDHGMNIYLRDMASNRVTLVDRASGARGAIGNAQAYGPTMSDDGRYIAFDSYATNLDPDDGHGKASNVYVRDLETNTTTLVSRASGVRGATGDGDSEESVISANGRYVAFASEAKNLAAGDRDAVRDIFVRDLKTSKTILATRSRYDVRKSGRVEFPAISPDGRVVAFVSTRPDLVRRPRADAEGTEHVLARDLDSGQLELISRATGRTGAPADGGSTNPQLSADGRLVAFDTLGTNLAPAGDPEHGYGQVFVRDRKTDTTVPVTIYPRPSGEDEIDLAEAQAISADGRFVYFTSEAAALHPGVAQFDANSDLFVRDMRTGSITLVSRASGPRGAPSDAGAMFAVASADGRFAVFMSMAGNLDPDAVAAIEGTEEDIEEDTWGPDLYRRDVLGPYGASARPGARAACPWGGLAVEGTSAADVRTGTGAAEVMSGRTGADVLRGGGGRDCIYGDAGGDRLGGGGGRDRVFGGSGADRADGGSGRDLVIGGSGDDRLRGQSGADRVADHAGRDRFSGGAGNDRIDARDRSARGRSRADTVRCGTGSDVARVDAADHVASDCERILRR